MAFIALLQACQIEQFAKEAQDGLDVLDHAVGQLQNMWASANVIRQGFVRLRGTRSPGSTNGTTYRLSRGNLEPPRYSNNEASLLLDPESYQISHTVDEFDWTLLFPFVTGSTNQIAECLLADKAQGTMPSSVDVSFHEALLSQSQDLLEFFTDYTFEFADLAFHS